MLSLVEAVLWACMAANGTGPQQFIDDLLETKAAMDSEVYFYTPCSHSAKCYKMNGMEHHGANG